MKEQKIILPDSDEAASIKTVTGWVSSDGRWWGDDERTARHAGCTHQKCKCGSIIEKYKIRCDSCQRKENEAKFDALEKKVWDGQEPIVIDDDDRYFFDEDELMDFCFEHDVQPQDLRLRICQPVFGRRIDDDYFCDELAEDGEVPDIIREAMENLNKAIVDAGPLSWYPSKYAAVIPEEYKVVLNEKEENK